MKDYIATLIVGLLIIGVVGYIIWNNPNYFQSVVQPPETTTNSTNTVIPVEKAGSPIVQTDSTTVPYISTVVVKGTVNPNGASTTYWYEYGQTSGLGSKTPGYLIGAGYNMTYTPAYITGLLSNTNYSFRLVAKNAFGTVNGQTYSFRTNTIPAPTGNAPTTSTTAATDISRTTVNLHGKINPNGSETTFWFEYGTSSELGLVTAFQSTGDGSASLPVAVSISNLLPLTKYYFRLNAQNQFGTVNGQILHFTTSGPAVPSAPILNTNSATSVTNSSARLNANINPGGSATTYWFEYGMDASLSSAIEITPELSLNSDILAVNVSVNVSNLNNNTKYYYRVVAKNQYGTVNGNIKSFTTKR